MAKKLPSIIDTCDSLLLLDGSIVALDSQKFLVWLENNQSFRFDCGLAGKDGYTVRKERTDYWYAYKKMGGKLHKVYIGNATQITMSRLLEVAEKLQSNLDVQPKQRLQTQAKQELHIGHDGLQNEVVQQLCVTVKELQETIALLTKRIEVLEASNKVEESSHTNQLDVQNQQLKEENQQFRNDLIEAYTRNNEAYMSGTKLAKQLEFAEQRILELEQQQQQPQPQPQLNSQTLDDFLTTLKLGKQSPDYKAAKKWVSKFVHFFTNQGVKHSD